MSLFQNIKQILFIGGNSVDEDVNNFKKQGGTIVICTPGRLEDLLTRRPDLNLAASVKALVRSYKFCEKTFTNSDFTLGITGFR